MSGVRSLGTRYTQASGHKPHSTFCPASNGQTHRLEISEYDK